MTSIGISSRRTGISLADRVRQWALTKPDAPCLTGTEGTRNWAEVWDRSTKIAQGLIAGGQSPGSRVLYVGRNSTAFIEVLIATSMAGCVITSVNWRLAAQEMRQVVEHSTATLAFVEDEFSDLLAMACAGPAPVPRTVVVGGEGHETFERWLAGFDPVDPPGPAALDDVAMQMYTSGTTGVPKGALFTNGALRAIDVGADLMGIHEEATVLIVIPIFHAGGAGAAMIALSSGAHLVVSPRTDADALAAAIEKHHVSALTLVPTILGDLVSRPEAMRRDLSSLDVVSYCGSPISPQLLRDCLSRFTCEMVQMYGLTEVNGVTVLRAEDHLDAEHPERLLSAGRPLDGVVVRVVDPATGLDVQEETTGEIWIKSPTAMSGYFRSPEQTAEAMTADGFVRSGDGGFLRDGYLFLRDRIKDMVVTGGENVYPVEVEKVLAGCPGVDDVAVIGVPSTVWGETVKAFVVGTDGADPSERAILAFAKQRLAGYKCPTTIEFVDALPRNASGKLMKRVLRDPQWVHRHHLLV